MHTIWKQCNPHWNITQQRLLDQKRVISSVSVLSDAELNELKQQLGIGGQSQDETDQSHGIRTVQDTTNLAHAENTTAPNSHDSRQHLLMQ